VSQLALRRLGWAHPELGALAYAAFAWMTLLLLATGDQGIQSAHQAVHRSEPLLAGLSGWFVMCVAMMIPAASFHARQLALSARWERRQQTITLFFAGYLGVWMAVARQTSTPQPSSRSLLPLAGSGPCRVGNGRRYVAAI
jgi:Predicted metal-binding integral membrane protein (DUF2182)